MKRASGIWCAITTMFCFWFPVLGQEMSNQEIFLNYFPVHNGSRWEYEVTYTPKQESLPLFYRLMKKDSGAAYEMRGTLGRLGKNTIGAADAPKKLILEAQTAEINGDIQNGYKLLVRVDEAGVFDEYAQVFLAAHDVRSLFPALLIGTCDRGGKMDYFTRTIFFTGEEDDFMTLEEGEKGKTDRLYYLHNERYKLISDHVDFSGSPAMHFQRVVERDWIWSWPTFVPGPNGVLVPIGTRIRNGFTEDMWFLAGKGLAKLQQKVDGQVTMTLTLKNCFHPTAPLVLAQNNNNDPLGALLQKTDPLAVIMQNSGLQYTATAGSAIDAVTNDFVFKIFYTVTHTYTSMSMQTKSLFGPMETKMGPFETWTTRIEYNSESTQDSVKFYSTVLQKELNYQFPPEVLQWLVNCNKQKNGVSFIHDQRAGAIRTYCALPTKQLTLAALKQADNDVVDAARKNYPELQALMEKSR